MTRRRYVWNEATQALEEIGLDVELPARVELQTGNHYEGLRATDGTRIDTPRRHREYMKQHDLAVDSDFKQTRAEAPKRRAELQRRERRETLGRVTHALETRQTRRR
jgi:hypothetical protein